LILLKEAGAEHWNNPRSLLPHDHCKPKHRE